MPKINVASAGDPRLAAYCDLRADRERRDDPRFICEGHLCVERALTSGWHLVSVLGTEPQLDRLPFALQTDVFVASPAVLQEVVGFKFHRGVLAEVDKPRLAEPVFSARHRTVVFAEVLSNPSNLGALVRNARSLGADLLVLCGATDPFSRRAVRASMGAVFELALCSTLNVVGAFAAFRQATGGQIVAATLGPKATPLGSFSRPEHLAIVMGSEGEGLQSETIAACDHELTIEMAPGSDSLNVAAASAVLLYALRAPTLRPND